MIQKGKISRKTEEEKVVGIKKKIWQNQGITLIALVVTIVVLLILAGITITYVMGDNSIFKLAKNEEEITDEAAVNEKVQRMLTDYMLN